MQRIDTTTKFTDLFGAGKHGFRDGNKSLGIAATAFNAAWVNAVQEEIATVIESTGVVLDAANRGQMATAIQTGKMISSTAGGTADAITAAFTPAIAGGSLVNGMLLSVKATSTNATATPTFTPNSGVVAAKTVVKGSNLPLAVGDISGWCDFKYDSALDKWVLLNPATGTGTTTAGQVLQSVSYATGAMATGTTTIPYDDTPPQDTEGTQFMTLPITPKSTNSKIIIECTLLLYCSAGGQLISAVFASGTANAVTATTSLVGAGGGTWQHSLRAEYTNASLAAKTFNIRSGNSAAATVTFNGDSGARKFGGIGLSTLKLTEVAQ